MECWGSRVLGEWSAGEVVLGEWIAGEVEW